MLERLCIEESGVPIYLQLRHQFLAAVGSGTLKPGDQVPTMRQVSVALRVAINTVQQAYNQLEQDGVFVTQRGRGTFVSERPPPVALDDGAERTRRFAEQTIAMATAQGLDPAAVGRTIIALVAGQQDTKGE